MLPFFLLFVCGQELFNDFPPIYKQGSKGVQVEAPNLSFRVGRNEFSVDVLFFPLRFA